MEIKTYPQYKESRINWVGEIPHDWDTQRVKNIMTLKNGDKPTFIEEGKYPVIGANGQIGLSNNYNITKDTIIIGRVGSAGAINIAKNYSFVSDNAIIAQTNQNLKWVFYLFNSMNLDVLINKNAQPIITGSQIKNLSIPKISIGLQEQIAKYLDKKTSQIKQNINKNKKLIELLKEKRTALINQAVTKGLNPDTPMKESGIEWIGEIPKHWKKVQLRAYFIEHKNKNKSLKETNLLSLSYGKIIQKDIHTKEGLLPENFENYNVIKKGYIVLRLTDLQNDKKSLRTGLCTEKGIITSAYVTIKSFKEINSTYVHYLLHSYDINKIFYNMGCGVRQNMNFKEFSRLPLLIPYIDEQEEIVTCLNNQTQLIDKTIEKIERNIELLEEYKESLIHYVVTGKIDVRGVEV